MTLRNSAETLETSPALHWCAALRSAWQQRRAAMAQPCQYGQVGGAGMEMPKAHTHTHTHKPPATCTNWGAGQQQDINFFDFFPILVNNIFLPDPFLYTLANSLPDI